jgi:hypothetical protein
VACTPTYISPACGRTAEADAAPSSSSSSKRLRPDPIAPVHHASPLSPSGCAFPFVSLPSPVMLSIGSYLALFEVGRLAQTAREVLGNDRGDFWRELARQHGSVRLLSERCHFLPCTRRRDWLVVDVADSCACASVCTLSVGLPRLGVGAVSLRSATCPRRAFFRSLQCKRRLETVRWRFSTHGVQSLGTMES